MQLIPEEVSTCRSSMAIIDGEEGAPRPLIHHLELGLDNIEYYTNTVFIIIPDNALMGIGRIAAYDSVLLASELGWMIALNVSIDLLLLHLHVLLLLLNSHDKSSISYQLTLAFRLLHRLLLNRFSLSDRWLRLRIPLLRLLPGHIRRGRRLNRIILRI